MQVEFDPICSTRCEPSWSSLAKPKTIEDMRMTSFHLHPLKGDRKGLWSVTVRANWRIVFRFENGDAAAVDLIDYH